MNQLVESSALAEVACHVLETTAFAFSQVCVPGESSMPDVGVLRAEIRFAGDASGLIRLEAAYEAATNIAGNLLGVDCDDISETQAMEAMCELLNIIAGQWLTRAFGVTAVFQLGIPQSCDDADELEHVVDLLVEDYPIRLQLQVSA